MACAELMERAKPQSRQHFDGEEASGYYWSEDPFGVVLSQATSGNFSTEYQFVGAYGVRHIAVPGNSPGNAFDHSIMGQRMYDTLGRFLTRDQIKIRTSHNVYVYANNNPIRFIDPKGLWTCPAGECIKIPQPPWWIKWFLPERARQILDKYNKFAKVADERCQCVVKELGQKPQYDDFTDNVLYCCDNMPGYSDKDACIADLQYLDELARR